MKIKVHAETKLSGHYEKIEVLRADGSTKEEYAGFCNLIVDGGLSRLSVTGHNIPVFNFCRVGTGSATPTESDNNLQAQIASTQSTTFSEQNNPELGFAETTVQYTFALGAVQGNISEIATGWADSGANTIFSRARVLDGNGNPTSITILADEILRVTWSHRRYWPSSDMTGSLNNTGNKGGDYSWICRAAMVGSWKAGSMNLATMSLGTVVTGSGTVGYPAFYTGTRGLGDVSGRPNGVISSSNQFTATIVPSPPNASTLRLSFSTTQGNFATGINSFKFGSAPPSAMEYQIEFTPPLIKTANDLMQVDFTHSWGRR